MGQIENPSSPYWKTFVEAETRIHLRESDGNIDFPKFIANLTIPTGQLIPGEKTAESIRHIVYANDLSKIEKFGSNRITVILDNQNEFEGHVRPKRKYLPSLSNIPTVFTEELEQYKNNFYKSIDSCKTELPIIRFDSPASKHRAIIEGLYHVGVGNPENYTYSQPFLKSRYARYLKMESGLIIEVDGDRIITPDKIIHKIELEIAPPFAPNREYIGTLKNTTILVEQQLRENGHHTYKGQSNSKMMRELINPDNNVDADAIKQLKARCANETIIFENNQNQSIAA